MRTLSPILLALLSGAYGANAVNCNPHQLRSEDEHSGTQLAEELLGALGTISEGLCKENSVKRDVDTRVFEYDSLVFTISQEDSKYAVTDCSAPFSDIISECISEASYWGGSTSFQGLKYEIYNKEYPANVIGTATLVARARTTKKTTTKASSTKTTSSAKTSSSTSKTTSSSKTSSSTSKTTSSSTTSSSASKPTSSSRSSSSASNSASSSKSSSSTRNSASTTASSSGSSKSSSITRSSSGSGVSSSTTKSASATGNSSSTTRFSSSASKTSSLSASSSPSILGCKPRRRTSTTSKRSEPTEVSAPRHARDFSVSKSSTSQIFRRAGPPPPQCQDDNAGEDQGCFTVQDASGNAVHFALPAGTTDFGGGLGAGEFGGVTQCIRKDGEDIAVKVYKNANSKGAEKSFNVLKLLTGSGNIVKAFGQGKVQGKPALAMENLGGGSVKSRIPSGEWKGKANERQFKAVAQGILNGVSDMHAKQIAHIDIHEGNVAFDGDKPKFVDFDFACQNQDCLNWVPADGRAPPEAIEDTKAVMDFFNKGGPPPPKLYINPFANDVWTTATMLIYMTTGSKTPATNSNRAFKNAWSELDLSKRTTLLFKVFTKENFSYEFVELLAGVFTKEENRIKINEFRDRFRDLDSIYC
ncbi:unnamed protein product [Periconia digitata]|uniref:mitogen-activated protein kinase n=1 Tax=Periconia digitata TaxID=1303443 RepID=A0A9W4UDX3_9PLEO|nr:unnamed protein product [Periconia digitata]